MHFLAEIISFNTINGWIETGGYAVLFGLLFACGLGLPLPEDIPLIISGALVARGDMHLVPAAICAWFGIIGGDIMLYHLGEKFGKEITRVRFVGKHFTSARIERVEQMFEQYGVFVVGVGRLFAGVRGAMVVAAGITRYNFIKFIIADGIAAVFSGGFFMFVGHLLGTHLNEQNISEFKHYFIAGAAILAIIVVGWILWRKKRAVDRMEKAAAAAEKVAEKAHIKPANPGLTNPSEPSTVVQSQTKESDMALEAIALPYPSDALEPSIDKLTMEIHHGKHYATYVTNFNKALEQAPQLAGKPLEEILANNLAGVPDAIKTAVRNNGGGALNHAMFWQIMGPKSGGKPVGNTAKIIDSTFGSFDSFKEKFKAAGLGRFGSGWAWLVKKGEKYEIMSTANQDSPIMEGAFPVFGVDVWEHAYYLKYQNRRPDYLDAWWNVVNWNAIEQRLNRGK